MLGLYNDGRGMLYAQGSVLHTSLLNARSWFVLQLCYSQPCFCHFVSCHFGLLRFGIKYQAGLAWTDGRGVVSPPVMVLGVFLLLVSILIWDKTSTLTHI